MHYIKPRKRRMLRAAIAAMVLIGVVAVGNVLWSRPDATLLTPSSNLPVSTPNVEASTSQAPTLPSSPEPSASPSPAIADAPPTMIFVPSDEEHLVIRTEVKPMQPCQELIDPPRDSGVGDIYYCTDFAMPGTNSQGKTVIAGHASSRVETWLNRLQTQGQSMIGREVLLQTMTSGQQWLSYTVTGVYQPLQEELPYMTEVWGAPHESTSGRLVMVTCLIDGAGPITHNYVVVAEFSGVKG